MLINQLKNNLIKNLYIFQQIKNRLSIEFINQITMLISLPIIANALGLNSFAIASQGMIIIQLIMLISAWGIDGYSIEELNKNNDVNYHNLFISSVIVIRFSIIIFLTFLLYVIINLKILDLSFEFFWYILFAIIAMSLLPLWYFQAIGKSQLLLWPTLLGRSIFVALNIFFITNPNSIKWVFISQGISSLIISVCGIYILMKQNHRLLFPPFKRIKNHFVKSTSHFFVFVINNQFNSLWSAAIIFLGSITSVAFFNLSNQFLKAGMGISELLARVIRQTTFNKNISEFKKFIFFISLIYLFIGIAVIFSIKYLIGYLFSEDYLQGILVFQLITVTWFLNAIYKLLNYSILLKIFNTNKANSISIKIGMIHVAALVTWLLISPTYTSLTIIIYMTLACFFQLIIIFSFISFFSTKNSYIDKKKL